MKNFLRLSLLIALNFVQSKETSGQRTFEGSKAVIECSYSKGYERNAKYLSKGTYYNMVVVIKSQKDQDTEWTHGGRYALHDDIERRIFTVTITNLTIEDTDTYWCGVDRSGIDHYTKIMLTVERARPRLSTSDSSNVTTEATVGANGTTSPATAKAQGGLLYSGVGLGAVLLLLLLVLFVFFRQRRNKTRMSTASRHSARPMDTGDREVENILNADHCDMDPPITNMLSSTTTNHNPDTDITIDNPIYAVSTNQNSDKDIYSNVGQCIDMIGAPESVNYATVFFTGEPDSGNLSSNIHPTVNSAMESSGMYSNIQYSTT